MKEAMKMTVRKTLIAASVLLLALLPACGGGDSTSGEVIKKIPLNSHTEVITRNGTTTDKDISRDGKGSLKIDVKGTLTLPLYRFGDIDLEDAFLVYQAALRTENLDGETFLEMRCYFQEKGEFFSRNYNSPLSGTTDWTVRSTPFRLKPGENPDVVELNIYVSGRGTVWIDDIRLLKRPLN
jgi:hypothetical protein